MSFSWPDPQVDCTILSGTGGDDYPGPWHQHPFSLSMLNQTHFFVPVIIVVSPRKGPWRNVLQVDRSVVHPSVVERDCRVSTDTDVEGPVNESRGGTSGWQERSGWKTRNETGGDRNRLTLWLRCELWAPKSVEWLRRLWLLGEQIYHSSLLNWPNWAQCTNEDQVSRHSTPSPRVIRHPTRRTSIPGSSERTFPYVHRLSLACKPF